jgi:hypothetical protein
MITIKLLCWIAYIAVDVWINYHIIEVNKARPNYLLLFIVRGIAFLLWAKFVVGFEYSFYYLNYFIFAVTSFWILLDLSINVARRKHLFYIGPSSGWIDRLGFKYPSVYYVAKVIALVWLVLSIINIYNP